MHAKIVFVVAVGDVIFVANVMKNRYRPPLKFVRRECTVRMYGIDSIQVESATRNRIEMRWGRMDAIRIRSISFW